MVKAFTPWGVEVNFYTLWCNGQHCKEYPLAILQSLRRYDMQSCWKTVAFQDIFFRWIHQDPLPSGNIFKRQLSKESVLFQAERLQSSVSPILAATSPDFTLDLQQARAAARGLFVPPPINCNSPRTLCVLCSPFFAANLAQNIRIKL